MAPRELRLQMQDFVVRMITKAGLYEIKGADIHHIIIRELPSKQSENRTIDVLLHSDENDKLTKAQFDEKIMRNSAQQICTTNIFLEDGITFYVRLGARGNLKSYKSLKNLPKDVIDSAIDLRDLEKMALGYTRTELSYYHPKSPRLPEMVRVFTISSTWLDYSHLHPGDNGHGFARDDFSRDYRRTEELDRAVHALRFEPVDLTNVRVRSIPLPPVPVQARLFALPSRIGQTKGTSGNYC